MKWAFDLGFFMYTQVLLKSLPRPLSTPSISLVRPLIYAANSPHESGKNKISEHAAVSLFFKMKLDIFKSDGGKLYVLYYVQLQKQTFIFLY